MWRVALAKIFFFSASVSASLTNCTLNSLPSKPNIQNPAARAVTSFRRSGLVYQLLRMSPVRIGVQSCGGNKESFFFSSDPLARDAYPYVIGPTRCATTFGHVTFSSILITKFRPATQPTLQATLPKLPCLLS
ncbi:hypothetical protein FPV67DRAFT_641958 [Lyophyllum atratum]|nr:hypothetical protein FPV67DRAFT_641958 [Lyophyllum atratum]